MLVGQVPWLDLKLSVVDLGTIKNIFFTRGKPDTTTSHSILRSISGIYGHRIYRGSGNVHGMLLVCPKGVGTNPHVWNCKLSPAYPGPGKDWSGYPRTCKPTDDGAGQVGEQRVTQAGGRWWG